MISIQRILDIMNQLGVALWEAQSYRVQIRDRKIKDIKIDTDKKVIVVIVD